MWFGLMWWWLIPLMLLLMAGGHRRRRYWRGMRESDRGEVTELRRVVEDQRGYIDDLEARLARVEDGLEFAERLLADRRTATSAG